jgi:hypothetical protein
MGGVWTQETTTALAGASLRALFAPAGKLDGAYAVGMGGVIARRVGGAWERDTLPIDPGGSGNFYAVTGAADGAEVHIAGEYGLILHRAADGSHWVLDKLPPPSGTGPSPHLFALYLLGSDLFVAGAGGLVEHRSGSSGPWQVEPTGTANDLYSLAGAGVRSLLAVGARGSVLRRQ